MTLSPTHIVLMIIASIIVTPPLVLLVPHARQSPVFDRLLWGGTLLTAFLGTWLGIANWSDVMPDPSINDVPVPGARKMSPRDSTGVCHCRRRLAAQRECLEMYDDVFALWPQNTI
jgi:hypothetical protein